MDVFTVMADFCYIVRCMKVIISEAAFLEGLSDRFDVSSSLILLKR